MQHNTVQDNGMQHNTTQSRTTQHRTTQHYGAAQHSMSALFSRCILLRTQRPICDRVLGSGASAGHARHGQDHAASGTDARTP